MCCLMRVNWVIFRHLGELKERTMPLYANARRKFALTFSVLALSLKYLCLHASF